MGSADINKIYEARVHIKIHVLYVGVAKQYSVKLCLRERDSECWLAEKGCYV